MSEQLLSRHARVRAQATRIKPWRRYRLATLLVITLVIGWLLQGYLTHPGLHVAGATFLLDIILLKHWFSERTSVMRQSRLALISFIVITVVANILGLLAVFLSNDDPFAMTIGTLEGCLSVLLLLFS